MRCRIGIIYPESRAEFEVEAADRASAEEEAIRLATDRRYSPEPEVEWVEEQK